MQSQASHFDVVVIGAGPGGYVAAIRAAQLGKRVAVIERQFWGGICLNVGCIPTKALLRNAEVVHLVTAQASTFGLTGHVDADYAVAVERARAVAAARVRGVHYLMKKNSITEIDGYATLRATNDIEVHHPDGTPGEILSATDIIIATGSTTKLLPGTSLSPNVVTYLEQIFADRLPSTLLVIGAGAIGMEFATILSAYGVTVTIVEFLDRVLPSEDPDISAEVSRRFTRRGIAIKTSTAVTDLSDDGQQVSVALHDHHRDTTETIVVDKVLQAVGFAPNVTGFGLDVRGVALTDRGAIAIDDQMRTSAEGVYAIGDVTGKLALAHVAEAQGIVAAETLAGAPTLPITDYAMMPRVTFCQPQVASFGLTEPQARAAYDDGITVASFPFTANGKAPGLAASDGFVKLISSNRYGEILGAHLVGAEVSELLPELTLAQKWDLTVTELIRNIHAHPTLGEAVQDALHGLAGHFINL
ncbi:dihydrolipoyl dehydrogenase [Mycolicibacterium sp. 018/SC-01/001]|uniref:dihydrolipoyl dehydrogenase n=1 Tax=Mycolicibacterium sp. 018/SC-01/001 TaxID=2592069 RepID=UPI00117FF865|nr:dihydrolipoyl dehydrogenase [Mycolicibacterium sp. 018/SC-01/001]TRW89159.1 dihydrolipoyl dehydrogenase [Mycolicibacterium sp. 018/SC-01/001]